MKRRLLWFIEVFVWLFILFLVSCGIMFAKYNYKQTFDTYQIFLPDVDGLIVGSPVKLMGIQIGYVNQLDITGEDLYVNFIITDTDVKIPRGAKATVEFSGLGGSKSLELYPPSPADKESSMFIVPQPPKRIHDSLGLLNDMFESAIDIAYDISHFMEKMGFIKGENKTGVIETKHNIISIRKKLKQNKTTRVQEVFPQSESTKPSPAHTFDYSTKSKFIHPISHTSKDVPIDKLLENSNDWLDKVQKQCDKFNKKFRNRKVREVEKKEVGKNGKGYGKSHGKN